MPSRRITKRKNIRNHPYVQSENVTSAWTNKQYREELLKLGIKIPQGMSKTIMKQLYDENIQKNTAHDDNNLLHTSLNFSDQPLNDTPGIDTERSARNDSADITTPQLESSAATPSSLMNNQLTSVVNTLCQNFQETITKIITC